MNPAQQLHEMGQSLWLDDITSGLLTRGTLSGYISDLSITGLTSNPSIFDHSIDAGKLAAELQQDGAAEFVTAWKDLLVCKAAAA